MQPIQKPIHLIGSIVGRIRTHLNPSRENTDAKIGENVSSTLTLEKLPPDVKRLIFRSVTLLKLARTFNRSFYTFAETAMLQWVKKKKQPLINLRLSEKHLISFIERNKRDLLHFDAQGLSDQIIQKILKLCPDIPSIRVVDFEHMDKLNNPHLASLEFNWKINKIIDSGTIILRICDLYSHLKRLHLRGLQFESETVGKLTKLTDLKKLQLVNVGLANASHVIGNMKNLTWLDILNVNLQDQEAVHLSESLPNLSRLCLAENKLTDAGAIAIAKGMKFLTTLNVADNDISSEGAIVIAQELLHLKNLNLENNPIGDKGAIAIGRHKKIEWLNLNNCEIRNGGAHGLRHLTQLHDLLLACNHIQAYGARYISQLKSLTFLVLYGNNLSDSGVSDLARLPNLQAVSLGKNELRNEATLELAKLANLHDINLSHNKITDEGAIILARIPQLTVLVLSFNPIKNRGAEALAQSSAISLHLDHTEINDEGALTFRYNTKLEHLDLSNNAISLRSIQQLIKELIKLQRSEPLNLRAWLTTFQIRPVFI